VISCLNLALSGLALYQGVLHLVLAECEAARVQRKQDLSLTYGYEQIRPSVATYYYMY
jgi:hypothetical protein